MKSGIVAAWLAGEAIVIWRAVHAEKRIPAPGLLLGVSALFIAGAFVADVAPKTEGLVLAVLVGLDVAALLNVLPAGLGKQIDQAQAAEQSALAPVPGGGSAAPGAPAGTGSAGNPLLAGG